MSVTARQKKPQATKSSKGPLALVQGSQTAATRPGELTRKIQKNRRIPSDHIRTK